MTKDVLLSISGLQFAAQDEEDVEPVEVITAGDYYKKNGKHYILYDEVMEGFDGNTRNIIKLTDDSLDITKKGVSNVHMVFEKNKKNVRVPGFRKGKVPRQMIERMYGKEVFYE